MRYWAFLLLATIAPGEEWARFRGPNGTGISRDTGFPVEFGPSKNLVWRAAVRPGKSSPVLTATKIFLTGFEKEMLYTQCFDRATGKLLWERSERRIHKEDVQFLNHPAAITPVTDGENVYAFFKDFGLLSYDSNGKLRWRVPLGPFTNSMGLGASPILAGDLLILQADQLTDSYMAAYSTRNGELRWKAAREESESWATPVLYSVPGAVPQIMSAGALQVGAHRVSDGKRTFSFRGASPAMVASPIIDGSMIYAFGYGAPSKFPFSPTLSKLDKNQDGVVTPDEYGNDPMMTTIATKMGNKNGVLDEVKWNLWMDHVAGPTGLIALQLSHEDGDALKAQSLWQFNRGFDMVVPSPLLYDGIVYVVKNGGILSTFDAKTGEQRKAGRISGAPGGYSASLVLGEGRIYAASEEGKIAVIHPGEQWEVLQVNDVGDGFFATPALSGARIFAPSMDTLYCFGLTRAAN